MIKAPRVYVHAASFTRLGRLSMVSKVNRSYTIDNRDVATFTVSLDDPLIQDMRPSVGRLIVIESSSYTDPWVGKLVSVSGGGKDRMVSCKAKGYASTFDHRLVGPSFTSVGTPTTVISHALREVNLFNDTGVVWGSGGSGVEFQINAPNQKARVVFDRAAEFGNQEWYLNFDPSPETVDIQMHAPSWRGLNRYNSVRVNDGVSGRVEQWREDGESASFMVTVVGSMLSATQPANDRSNARAILDANKIQAPHGYLIDGSEIAANILTSQERVIVSEELKAAGSASVAAEAILARDGGVSKRTLRVTVTDYSLWPTLRVGDVFHLSSNETFVTGFDGPVRILAAQPDEVAGALHLAVQLLRRPNV